jgi:monoamine oxidase
LADIHTVYSDAGQVEMGATWFNDIHVSFRNLLSELGLEHFEQFMTNLSGARKND